MKTRLSVIALAYTLAGCGGEGNTTSIPVKVPTASVKPFNLAAYIRNGINLHIDLGQSNCAGPGGIANVVMPSNVFMPLEAISPKPDYFTFGEVSSTGINKWNIDNSQKNTAVYLAANYEGDTPLYVLQICEAGQGIHLEKGSEYDHWSPDRSDSDGKSLYPKYLHYMSTLVKQLRAEGIEPKVVSVNWNQWFSSADLPFDEFYESYVDFFEGIYSVIPNKDAPLFLVDPILPADHVYTAHKAYHTIADTRPNTYIYTPSDAGEGWVTWDGIHYSAKTHKYIAEFIGERYEHRTY